MSSPVGLREATATLTAQGAPYEMIRCDVRGIALRCFKHVPPTLRELVVQSRRWDDRDYLVYEGERLTYAQAYAQIAALAHGLVDELSVRKGDRVAIAMRNYPEWVIAFWASTRTCCISIRK